MIFGGIILYLPISICPSWALKIGGLTSGVAVRGTNILILIKSIWIVLIPYSIDIYLFCSPSDAKKRNFVFVTIGSVIN